jgi:hypothetical protein
LVRVPAAASVVLAEISLSPLVNPGGIPRRVISTQFANELFVHPFDTVYSELPKYPSTIERQTLVDMVRDNVLNPQK